MSADSMDPALADLLAGRLDDLVVCDDSGEWTRGELVAAVARAADTLRLAGVSPGDRVAVKLRSSARSVAALLAARAVGAIACPVDPAVPTLPDALRDSIVVADAQVAGHRTLSSADLFESSARSLDVTDGEAAWGISTSGSSGRPKTVVLHQRSVAHITRTSPEVVGYRDTDRVLCTLPFHHVYGLSQLWNGLRARSLLLIAPQPIVPAVLAAWLPRATVFPTVPPMLRLLLSRGVRPPLRLVTLSGQATLPDDREAFARALPGTGFLQFYGLTEATRALWLSADEFLARPEAAGRPCPGMTASLDDNGELWLAGPNVAAGYLDHPDLTAERFMNGRLRTGDIFERDGDLYRFVGRSDGMFKSFGEKIIPEVIERVIRSHPGVDACLVVPQLLHGEPRPVVWAVARGAAPPAEDLVAFARERLPSALVPVQIRFVSSLPTTASGKLKRAVPDPVA